ncbi:MAG: hypothetical protein KGI27_04615 [Thaumarchaeota archaeon]|nr:hypothetical protein [Nitrososphaerota archaeon]
MIRPARKRLWAYNHGNTRLLPGSRSSKLLEALYPDNKKTLAEIRGTIGSSAKVTVSRLKKRNFVRCNQDRTFSLTDLGRWYAVCLALKISFLEMCILACACCTHKRYASAGKTGFYMHSTFEGILKRYYSRRYLVWIFASITRKGFAVKLTKRAIGISRGTWEDLMSRYGGDFKRLEVWLDNLEERELDVFSEALEGFELGGEQTN